MDSIQIISPHQDDAAFSLASTLAELVKVPIALKIINCFTVSDYAPFLDGPRRVIDVRRSEDMEFVRKLGGTVSVLDLGYFDAPLRFGVSSEQVCGFSPAIDPARGDLCTGLRDLLTAAPLIVPLGLGDHVDHVLSRNEGLSAAGSCPLAFYEDLPYASRFSDVALEAKGILNACGIHATESHCRTHSEGLKRFLISGYSSQASSSSMDDIAGFRDGQESLWMTKKFEKLWLRLGLA